jgi:leucyl aminopeptidase
MNLKPSDSMASMKDDMGGAAAVLGAMRAIGKLRPKANILALIPTTENMISGSATRVGDVILAMSGKTVEIDNTDAEGRLVLSDAAAYAEREGVDEIVDIATLTGACVVALGRGMAGIVGSDQTLVDRLIKAGAEDGEMLWQLPFHKDYRDNLKSEVADMRNAGGREGGAIIGALFIENHIKKTPWAHIDVAGPVTVDRETALSPKGSTGFGTATLVNYLLEG